MQISRSILAAAAIALVATGGHAATILHDDFGDGVLDPAWELVFMGTDSWTWDEVGGQLLVTDIVDPTENDDWARVRLRRAIVPRDDFTLEFDFAWDSEFSGDAMQNVFVRLVDGGGEIIAQSGAWDAWRQSPGSRYAQIGHDNLPAAPGSIPLTGNAEVRIERADGEIVIIWDGVEFFSGTMTAALARVEIEFSYYFQTGPSFFGSESVDRILLEASAVAAPDAGVPVAVQVEAAAPNPFNPRTTIGFTIGAAGPVRVEVRDLAGRPVATLLATALAAGRHEVVWDGCGLDGRPRPSGTYLVRVISGTATGSTKVQLVR